MDPLRAHAYKEAYVWVQSLYENEIKVIYSSSLNSSSKSSNFWLVLWFLAHIFISVLLRSFKFHIFQVQCKNKGEVITWLLFMWEFVMIIVQYLAYKEEMDMYIKAWEIT